MIIPGTEITIRHAEVGGGVQVEVIAADGTMAMSRGRATFY